MKILVISSRYPPYYIGGYEISCWNIVSTLRKRGHKVYVLAGNWKYPVDWRFSETGIYRELIYRHVYRVGISLKYTILREIKDNLTLKRIIKRIKPDLLYIFNMEGISKSLLITAESFKVPMVYDTTGDWLLFETPNDNWLIYWQSQPKSESVKFIKLKIQGLITKPILRQWFKKFFSIDSRSLNLKYLYFTSEWVKSRYTRHKFYLESAPVIYRGIDTEHFHNKRDKKCDTDEIKLLYLGRLTKDKGTSIAIEAFSILIKKGYKVGLSIAGTTRDKQYMSLLQNIIKQQNLPVKFLGNVIYEELPKVCSKHDIFVFPPTIGGPLSRTLLEAMGSGIPIVASPIGGTILKDNENCLIAKTADPEDFAAKIEILIKNPELRRKLGANACKFVKENFDIEKVVDKIENYLEWVMKDFRENSKVKQ